MENRKNFNTSRVPRTTEVFPQAVVAGKFIFLSGTPGFNPASGQLSESFEEQARQSFLNIEIHLNESLFNNNSFLLLDTLIDVPSLIIK